jgi:DNA-binding CsgD family transcriptional regulator/PAS domain-containing protein
MTVNQTVTRLLGTLYAAPTAPELWGKFLGGVCNLVGATNSALIAHDTEANEHRVFGFFGDAIQQSAELYAMRYWEFDEWTRRALPRLRNGKVLLGAEVWPERELLRSVFYNEFLEQFDIGSVASVAMGDVPREFEALSVYGSNTDQEFTAEDTAVLLMLQPHLQIALATRRRLVGLESRPSDLENAFNTLESAIVLLDAAGRVVFVNAAAHSILGEVDGLFLGKGNRLITRRAPESAKLIELISKAISTATGTNPLGGGVMPFPRLGKKPLHLLVSPLRSASAMGPRRAVVAIFLTDPERNGAVPADVLRTLFGLSFAEARLALSVLNGNSLSETAELNRVSRETVKSQMSAVFAKTGTRRQGELIRLLSHLPIRENSTAR